MQSNEILAVVDSVSTEKGLDKNIILRLLKLQLLLPLRDIFMKMLSCLLKLIEILENILLIEIG